jgi:hypothetical protein
MTVYFILYSFVHSIFQISLYLERGSINPEYIGTNFKLHLKDISNYIPAYTVYCVFDSICRYSSIQNRLEKNAWDWDLNWRLCAYCKAQLCYKNAHLDGNECFYKVGPWSHRQAPLFGSWKAVEAQFRSKATGNVAQDAHFRNWQLPWLESWQLGTLLCTWHTRRVSLSICHCHWNCTGAAWHDCHSGKQQCSDNTYLSIVRLAAFKSWKLIWLTSAQAVSEWIQEQINMIFPQSLAEISLVMI